MKIYTYRSGHKTLKKVLSITLSLLVLVQMTPAAFVVNSASANHDPFGGVPQTHVQLCHSGNGTNFVDNSPSITATGGNINLAGHEGHIHDIIPPFHFDDNGTILTYAGKNWNASSEDLWNNGDCEGDGIITPPVTTGTLTVTKVVSGGIKVISDFPLFLNGLSITSGVSTTTVSGSYTVTETTDSNYTAVFSGDCNSSGQVTVPANGSANCTLTNTYNVVAPQPGTITVTKIVSGGTKVVSDFPLFLNGLSITSGTATTTVAGTYTITETTDPHYVGVFTGDCDANGQVTVSAGGNANCTLTNTFTVTPPTTGGLIIHKWVINDNGGTVATSTFQFQVNGGALTNFESDGANEISGLVAGSYTVTESHPAYTTTFGGSCSSTGIIAVTAGATSTCVITNDDIAVAPTTGVLVVTKTVINDNNGTAVSGDFTLNVTGTNPTLSSFAGNASGTSITLDAGVYSVNENSFSGYTQTSNSCSGTIVAGATTTCEIINNDNAPSTQPVPGCMDVNANNYNSNATVDDGSCTYNSTSGGGSRGGGSRGTVLGINNDEPQGQVLGETFVPGLPATGNSPLNSTETNTLAILFVGLVTLVGLNLASFRALKLEVKSK